MFIDNKNDLILMHYQYKIFTPLINHVLSYY